MDRRLEAIVEAITTLLTRLDAKQQRTVKLIIYMPSIRRIRSATEGVLLLIEYLTKADLLNSAEAKAFTNMVLEKNLNLFVRYCDELKDHTKPLYSAISSRSLSEEYAWLTTFF